MARNLRCCCGQPACAYLEHNNAALGGLEKDLETAAKLGQVRPPTLCDLVARACSTRYLLALRAITTFPCH
jgi:hypothetical protein